MIHRYSIHLLKKNQQNRKVEKWKNLWPLKSCFLRSEQDCFHFAKKRKTLEDFLKQKPKKRPNGLLRPPKDMKGEQPYVRGASCHRPPKHCGAFDNAGLTRALDCPLSKGNQAATPKIERPNGKNTKSFFF